MSRPKRLPYHEFSGLSREEKDRFRVAYLGQCEVAGCEERAVAYHASAMWRLCAKHSARLAKRSRDGKKGGAR